MTQYLIIGSGGRVGSSLLEAFRARGWDAAGWGREECDLTDSAALTAALERTPAACVINCAAISGIEACLDHPHDARLVNALAPRCMARMCRLNHSRFIHLSTDYVLDGTERGLKGELSGCRPVNVYGASKLEGELAVLEENPDALIARVSWVFGNPGRPAFPEMILGKALQGQPLAAVADKDSIPTWLGDLTGWLADLASAPDMPSGLMHLCQSGQPATWHDYAQEVVRAALEAGFALKSTHVAQQILDDQTAFRDARARHTAMANTRLTRFLGRPVRTWQEAIRCWIASLGPPPPTSP